MYTPIICLLLFLLTIKGTKKKDRYPCNPGILFSGIWLLIDSLSIIKFFDINAADEIAHVYTVVGVAFFLLGYCAAYHLSSKSVVVGKNYERYNSLNYKLLIGCNLLCIVYYTPRFIISLYLLISGHSLNSIRGLVQQSGSILNYSFGLNNFLLYFVILPLATVSEVISIVDLIIGKKNKLLIGTSLILVTIRIVGDAGRIPLFNMVLYLSFCIFSINKDKIKYFSLKKAFRKYKKYVVAGIIFLVFLTFLVTSSTIARQIYFHFAMPETMFSTWIHLIDDSHFYGNGAVSLNGVLYPIDYMRKNLLGGDYLKSIIDSYTWIADTDSQWQIIAPGEIRGNAYVTLFWFFYADARLWGIIIGSFTYGIWSTRTYKKTKKHFSERNIAVLCLLLQGIFFSFIRFPFAKGYYVLAFIFISFFAYKKDKNMGNCGTLVPRTLTKRLQSLYEKLVIGQ